MQESKGSSGKFSKVRVSKAWPALGVLSLLGALAFSAFDVGAAPVVPVESGAGAENGRNVATMTISGVTGTLTLRSFSLGGERPEPAAPGSAGKFSQRLLTIVKPIDTLTPLLFASATGGNSINTMTLNVPATGVSAAATYTFSSAMIIAQRHSDKGRATSGQELEELSFFYNRLQVQVGNVVRCWDFATATGC